MSEDYTPSMDDIAEYYTACRMRGYDEVQGGEPYAIVRALLRLTHCRKVRTLIVRCETKSIGSLVGITETLPCLRQKKHRP